MWPNSVTVSVQEEITIPELIGFESIAEGVEEFWSSPPVVGDNNNLRSKESLYGKEEDCLSVKGIYSVNSKIDYLKGRLQELEICHNSLLVLFHQLSNHSKIIHDLILKCIETGREKIPQKNPSQNQCTQTKIMADHDSDQVGVINVLNNNLDDNHLSKRGEKNRISQTDTEAERRSQTQYQ